MFFSKVFISKLHVDEIKKIKGEEFTKLNLKDAIEGIQPDKSYILGQVVKTGQRVETSDSSPRRLLILKEVLEDNNLGDSFEAFLFGSFAHQIEQHLSNLQWIIFENTLFMRLKGLKKDGKKYRIKVVDDKARIKLIQTPREDKKLSQDCRYVNIKNILEVKMGQNILGIVKEILKYDVLNKKNNNRHSMIVLTDPSCYEESSVRSDLLLHIFFNKNTDEFPIKLDVGDIVRVREILTSMYQNKLEAKINHPDALTIFKIDDGDIYFYSLKEYIFSDMDKEKVDALYQWWLKSKEKILQQVQEESALNETSDFILKERAIKDISSTMVFTIYCMVIDIRKVSTISITVLRVMDGSPSKAFTKQIDSENATQTIMSQTDSVSNGTSYIDIIIHPPAYTPENLKPGDFVKLVNVEAVKLDEVREIPALSFYMRKKSCQILKMSENDSCIKEVIKRIKEMGSLPNDSQPLEEVVSQAIIDFSGNEGEHQNKENIDTNQETQPFKSAKKRFTFTLESNSSQRKSRRTDNLPSDSVQKSDTQYSLCNDDLNSQSQSASSTSEILDSIMEETFAEADQGTLSTTNIPRVDEIDNQARECSLMSNPYDENDIIEEVLERSSSSTNLSDGNTIIEATPPSTSKRNYPARTNCTSGLPTHRKPFSIHTECPKVQKGSLFSMEKGFIQGEKVRTWIAIESVFICTEYPCTSCGVDGCMHDWIWGFCKLCKKLLQPWQLRENFPFDSISDPFSLPCPDCLQKAKKRKRRKPDPSLKPFIRLRLTVADLNEPQIKMEASLHGDDAKFFFDVNPSFNWLYSDPPQHMKVKKEILRHYNGPIQLCFEATEGYMPRVLQTRLKYT